MLFPKRTIRVYLIARISEDAHLWNTKVCTVLSTPISVFMPQENNPYNLEHREMPLEVYEADIDAMRRADVALALPEFGSDCSYEVGWFSHSSKPTVVFVDTQKEWLRNWMVKGGVDYAVTTNVDTYRTLKADPILRAKNVIYIDDIRDLNRVIIYASLYDKQTVRLQGASVRETSYAQDEARTAQKR